jgi:tetratricopeptide (TPR) repeat protein
MRANLARTLAILTIFLLTCSAGGVRADDGPAWTALAGLDIQKAKPLFEERLLESPGDFDAMRGLFLCAYFDFDPEGEEDLVRRMVEADPANPYLLAVFEVVAAELSDRRAGLDLEELISRALIKHGDPALTYSGKMMLESVDGDRGKLEPTGWASEIGLAPGYWLSGQFDNSSNIAAYRPVPMEGRALDTLEVVVGKDGMRAGWTWVDANRSGDLMPGLALGNDPDFACQTRCFFHLAKAADVLILTGGACSMRILVDGQKALDDPKYRNAHQQGGLRVGLPEGSHEITAVLGSSDQQIVFRVAVVDTAFQAIQGLTWPRYAAVSPQQLAPVTRVHPLFDPFDSYVSRVGEREDTVFWKAMLRIYNAHEAESVRELEAAYQDGKLSPLGLWALHRSLDQNEEESAATSRLSELKQTASTAMVDYVWTEATTDDQEAKVIAMEDLNRVYPHRLPIELMAAMRPLLNRDYPGFLRGLEEMKQRYPNSSMIQETMRFIYQSVASDPQAAYEQFKESCDLTGRRRTEVETGISYLLAMKDYEQAMKRAEKAYKEMPDDIGRLYMLTSAFELGGRGKDLVPTLERLKKRYPYNLDTYDRLYGLYSNASEFDKAQQLLEEYHSLDPTAILPYTRIDSLHNEASFDSIFGIAAVDDFWDTEPTSEELGDSQHWMPLDRQQRLVFESGLVLVDVHQVYVLLDQQAVEAMQEYYLGFDSSERFNTLMVARRLRKGQPPLSGQAESNTVVFQDLRPGDAIELRYRLWRPTGGDLWKDYWESYAIHSSYYQRYWEFTILTNRDDITYAMIPPAAEPVIDTHCGYKRITWRGERTPAWHLDLALMPPLDEVVGKVDVTSIPSWDVINRWYNSISEVVLDDNPRASELARRLTQADTSDIDKLRSLYAYVVLDIPYQTIGFDYDSSVPHKPDDVLINRWGDCKDKAILLTRMLRDVGIEAWPVLVQSRDSGIHAQLPLPGFDHLITCCVIGTDTTFVDPTEVNTPPTKSISRDYAGQPCLRVNPDGPGELRRLPGLTPEHNLRKHSVTIRPDGRGGFTFKDVSAWTNQQAGERRDLLEGYSGSDLKRQMETTYSDAWGVTVILDSVSTDSLRSIDPVFHLTMQGTMDLGVQSVGATTVVGLPDMSAVPKTLVPSLAIEGKRDFPVDLRYHAGRYETVLEFYAPIEYGTPQLPVPVALRDSLFSFSSTTRWDQSSRKITVDAVLEIKDGYTSLERYQPFCKKIFEAYDAPLLFSRE